jgi:hypothetical protein
MKPNRDACRPAWFLPSEDDDTFARRQRDLFTDLIEAVGSADALWSLDTDPLPEEPLDESVVDPADLAFVTEVVARVDTVTPIVFGAEHRTIARRILARVAAHDPSVLRRRRDVARCAAALVWLVLHANHEVSRGGRMRAQWIWDWFGVGDCSGRGRTLRRAAGLEVDADDPQPPWRPIPLGDPALLHSRYRAALVRHRDVLLGIACKRRTLAVERTDGRVAQLRVNAQPSKVVGASKGVYEGESRAVVIVGFGDDPGRADYYALSVPEAHELIRVVQDALDGSLLISSSEASDITKGSR